MDKENLLGRTGKINKNWDIESMWSHDDKRVKMKIGRKFTVIGKTKSSDCLAIKFDDAKGRYIFNKIFLDIESFTE